MKHSLSDRRELWLSVGGGTVAGLIFVWAALWGALTHTPVNQAIRIPGHDIGDMLGLVVLPVVLVLVARHRSFLWVILYLIVEMFWRVTDRIVTGNGAGLISDLADNAFFACLAALFLSAPTALVRYLIRLRREQAARLILARQETMRQSHVPQEGVWPPPPMPPTG